MILQTKKYHASIVLEAVAVITGSKEVGLSFNIDFSDFQM